MNTKRYFSTARFAEGLCQLDFDADADDSIELLMPTEHWALISSETTQILSVDIASQDNRVIVSFVDLMPNKPNMIRANNPYSIIMSLDQTNLIPHIDREQDAVVFDVEDLAVRTHKLKVYIEDREEPVAEFENVTAFKNDKEITRTHVERYI